MRGRHPSCEQIFDMLLAHLVSPYYLSLSTCVSRPHLLSSVALHYRVLFCQDTSYHYCVPCHDRDSAKNGSSLVHIILKVSFQLLLNQISLGPL